MLNVGIIGLGSMGMTHLEVYSRQENAQVVALADPLFSKPSFRLGRKGNIQGQVNQFDLSGFKKYTDYEELIADPDVHAVDICTPCFLHKEMALKVIQSKKPLLIEKPITRNAADAWDLVRAVEKSKSFLMPAHCMRFWPGWNWLKQVLSAGELGHLYSLSIERTGSKPDSPSYSNGELSGGAHLDLHIHDSDFIYYLLGMPNAVSSVGRLGESGAVEHTHTRYFFDRKDILVSSKGEWTRLSERRPFIMRYEALFEKGSAVFDNTKNSVLTLYRPGVDPEEIPLLPTLGYDGEIAEFIRCVSIKEKRSSVVDVWDAYKSLVLVEAELESIETGKTVYLDGRIL